MKTSAAGKAWARLSVAVGAGEEAQWVSVAVFGEAAQRLCEALHKGDEVYAEGTLQLTEWTSNGGEKRTGLSVAAWKAEKLGGIGRKKAANAKASHAAPEAEEAEAGTSTGRGECQHACAAAPVIDPTTARSTHPCVAVHARRARGVRDLWKIVPALADVCVRQARHWNRCRGSQKACARPPHFGQRKPSGQRIRTSAARHCSSVP